MGSSTRDGSSSAGTSSPVTPLSALSTSSSATARPGNVSPAVSKDSSTANSPQALRVQISRNLTASVPASRNASPQPSRNSSPARQKSDLLASLGQSHTGSTDGSLRYKNDLDDVAAQGLAVRPIHNMTTTTSSQSLPTRASSTAVSPTSETAASKLPRSTRTLLAAPTSEASAASITSRSRLSPPNSTGTSRRNSIKPDPLLIAPAVTLQTSTPPTSAEPGNSHHGLGFDQDSLPAPSKTHSRGPSGPKSTLETVIEGTQPAATALAKALEQSISSSQLRKGSADRSASAAGKPLPDELQDRSESDGNLSDRRGRKNEPAPLGSLKARPGPARTAPPLTPRTKQAESTRNMTVETETVSSIPHSAINADRGTTRGDTGGSVKLESSYETVRPKRDKKKASRKAPSIHNGTASSKADIFEARVASVVDEADSDDSDETFVYESNPPEAGHPRSSRHHSRTPSTASITSLSDRRHYGNMGSTHRVSGKRSMKFSNNSYNNVGDSPPDGETGSIRTHQPRHISRFGRTMGSHTSLHGPDSPFTQANKIRVNLGDSGHLTPTSGTPRSGPKTAPLPRGRGPTAQWNPKSALYRPDLGDGVYSDDEDLPLLGAGTVRTPRNNRYAARTRAGGRRSLERIYSYQQRARLGRASACWIVIFAITLLLLLSLSGFSVMSNKTLYEVEVKRIENVLASERELMLDLLVGAINPNFVDVKVTNMDVNVFAKSSFVNYPPKNETTTTDRRRLLVREGKAPAPGTPWQDPEGRWGDDHDDYDDELGGDTQTMLLGRVYEFDQSLHFEGSPFRRRVGQSMGEMRLAEPGNRTESGGSARWERVLQHPFQLILRGVLKYQVPVTGRGESSAIYGSVIVHPEEGFDAYGRMRVEEG